MNQIQVGHFKPDGGLIYLPIGYIPDFFFMEELGGGDGAVLMYYWFRQQELHEASNSKEGVSKANSGATLCIDDDAGIAAYDSGGQGPTITDWSSGGTVVARTTTAHGTYIRTANEDRLYGAEREDVFEVIENTTLHTSEPTWPAAIGGQVTDGAGCVLEKVDVSTFRYGYQGVRIAAALMTDDQEMYYLALQADTSKDWGDVAGWTDGVYGK